MLDDEDNKPCAVCNYVDTLQFPICPACLYLENKTILEEWNEMHGISNAKENVRS